MSADSPPDAPQDALLESSPNPLTRRASAHHMGRDYNRLIRLTGEDWGMVQYVMDLLSRLCANREYVLGKSPYRGPFPL